MEPQALLQTLRETDVLRPLRPPAVPVPLGKGHWSTVLESALSRLNAGDAGVLEHFAHVSDEFAVLYDGFPKSRVHLLVMPRAPLNSAWELTEEHLPMLRRMAAYTTWLLEALQAQLPKLTWRQGVHAVPTLRQLHLHVLSQDFQSPKVKHKKHFNSFQQPFLVPLEQIVVSLESGRPAMGKTTRAEAEGWLKQDLRCGSCGTDFGNKFEALKKHLERCRPGPSAPAPYVEVICDVVADQGARRAEPALPGGVELPSVQKGAELPSVQRGRWARLKRPAPAEVIDLSDD